MDADGLGERGWRRHKLLEDELPWLPPLGAQNQHFGIAAGLEEEEGLGDKSPSYL